MLAQWNRVARLGALLRQGLLFCKFSKGASKRPDFYLLGRKDRWTIMTDYKMNRRPTEEYDSESTSSNNLLCPGTNGNMLSTGIRLITATEAARVLHVSRNAIYTL